MMVEKPDIRMGVFTIPVWTHRRVVTENRNAKGEVISQSMSQVPDKLVQVEVRVEVNMSGLAASLGRRSLLQQGEGGEGSRGHRGGAGPQRDDNRAPPCGGDEAMMAALYRTKKDLKAAVGKPLNYEETSAFGNEYKETGAFSVVGPSAYDRKWYARVTVKDGLIVKVT